MEVNFYAGAAEAAGRKSAAVELGDLTGTDLVGHLTEGNDRLARVMTCCTLLVDGLVLHDLGEQLPASAQIDVLPPFAGG